MNGIHDMGGMQGFGRIDYREDDPGYDEPWETRLFALRTALRIGSLRPHIERIPPAEYLRMGYYERWYSAMITQIVENGIVTRDELERGVPDPDSAKATPATTPAVAAELLFRTPHTEQESALTPNFKVGDRVRGRNLNPPTHTRMPRYTRGKLGVVERDRGVFNLPDSEEESGEARPQHVYLVRYAARELWGDEASPRDSLFIDMWENYLEPA